MTAVVIQLVRPPVGLAVTSESPIELLPYPTATHIDAAGQVTEASRPPAVGPPLACQADAPPAGLVE